MIKYCTSPCVLVRAYKLRLVLQYNIIRCNPGLAYAWTLQSYIGRMPRMRMVLKVDFHITSSQRISLFLEKLLSCSLTMKKMLQLSMATVLTF